VTDTGPAIEDELIEFINRSNAVHHTDHMRDHTIGLGLALTKLIVKKMRGQLNASSANGQTTFEVVLGSA
jgi:signal transduction histidine kinase